jgi:ABC-type multidrug transport system ATPase subunit
MPPIIETRDLTRRFASLTAADHLNLGAERGKIFAPVGPDGAGKNTRIRIMCGLRDPSEVSATLAGHDVKLKSDMPADAEVVLEA